MQLSFLRKSVSVASKHSAININRQEEISKDNEFNCDSMFKGSHIKNTKHCHIESEETKNGSKPDIQSNNLASGDHGYTSKKIDSTGNKLKSKRCKKIKYSSAPRNFECCKEIKGLETIFENKHMVDESDTDSFGLMSCPSLPKIKNETKIFPRPVRCPVLECRKMIAMDSVLLHFYFDHSKIGRITLDLQIPEQTHIKPSLLSENTQCLTIFLLQNIGIKKADVVNSGVLLNGCRQYCPLLLMATRLQNNDKSYNQNSCSIRTHSLCDIATQTESYDNFSGSSYSTAKDSTVYAAGDAISSNEKIYNNEIFLLWLCKLDLGRVNYSITIMNKDKNRGLSYIGEAIHIRDPQDSATMLENAQCLIIRGIAAKRLIDEAGKILVIINVFDCDIYNDVRL